MTPITITRNQSVKIAWGILIVTWIAIVSARIMGASDLYDKEQPRTVSYTADLLVNHHWLLQYDSFGIPETKPPLFTWVSSPIVALFGFSDWTLKAPSIVASMIVVAWIILLGRYVQSRIAAHAAANTPTLPASTLGVIAAILWLANPMTSRLVYLARSDMLLTAMLCGAWYFATILLDDAPPRRGTALAYWLCTIGAAFAKGPLCIFALLYLPLAARFIHGNLRIGLKRSGWWWGVPLLIATFGVWLALAWRQEPEFFRQVIFGREIAGRAAGAHAFFTQFFHGPLYMLGYFLPWSPAFLLALVFIPLRQWFKHPLGPVILWVLLIVGLQQFVSSKRADRYEPVFPAMALMAAYFLIYAMKRVNLKMAISVIAVVAIGTCIGLGAYHIFWVQSATAGYGTHLMDFARAVQDKAGNDPILFLDGQQTPLETLLGRAQLGPPTLYAQEHALWSIRYYDPKSASASDASGPAAVLISQPIMQVDGWFPAPLALYRLKAGQGVQEYEDSLKIPVAIADIDNPPPGEPLRWHQLWRYHTPRSAAQAGSQP